MSVDPTSAGPISADPTSAALDVAMLGHELRTPLAAIRAIAELLADDEPDRRLSPAERQRLLGAVVAEAERMSRLLDRLPDRTAATRPARSEIDLGATARAAAAGIEPLFRRAGIALAVSVPAAGPMVRGERDGMIQVVLNLLSNAHKFAAREGGRVTLRVDRDGEWARLTVADNGRGVPPAERTAIFDPGRRGAAAAGVPGAGLGLAICRRIAEAHGGRLWVEGEPGAGARFVFVLPLSADGGST